MEGAEAVICSERPSQKLVLEHMRFTLGLMVVFSAIHFDATEVSATERIEGTLVKIDLKNKKLLVREIGAKAGGAYYRINDNTEVYIRGKKAAMSKLKIGDQVLVLHERVRNPKGIGIILVVERIVKIEGAKNPNQ